MPELPIEEAIPRFKTNEDRVNTFVNGGPTESYRTTDGVLVPTLRKFVQDINQEGSGWLAQAQEAADTAVGAAATSTGAAATATGAAATATERAEAANVAKLNWRSAWVTATAYAIRDAVTFNGSSYVARVAHTSASTTQPGSGASWSTVWDVLALRGENGSPGAPGNGTGDVVGPASAVNDRIVVFNGTTGKILKDGGLAISGLATAAQGALADTALQPDDVTQTSTDGTAGRITKVGDYGLGGSGIAATNLNDLTVSGFYRITSANAASGNAPGGSGNWSVFHIRFDGATAQQIAVPAGSLTARAWVRTSSAGVWGTWERMVLANEITISQSDGTEGRITRVGDFGLGFDAIGSLDFDAIQHTGFYSGDSATAGRPGNAGNWLLTHIARVVGGTGQAVQTAVSRVDNSSFDGGETWTRARLENGTWTPWVVTYTSNNIAPAVEAAALINPRRNPSWHGAVGGANDSPTIQAWLTWVIENQAGEIPANARYNIGTPITINHSGRNFSIEGKGSRSSQFRVTSNNGGIRILSSSRNMQARLCGFGVLAAAQGGVGFEVSMPEGGMRDQSTLEADDVAAYCDDWGSGDTDYFATSLAFKGHFDPLFRNLRAVGPGALAGYGPTSARFLSAKGIDAEGCYDPKFIAPRIQNAQSGISLGIFRADIISAASGLGTTVVNLSAPTNVFTPGFQVRIMDASIGAMNGSYWVGAGANSSQVALWRNEARNQPVTFTGTFTGKMHQQAQAEAIQIDDANINGVLDCVDVFRPFLSEPTMWVKGGHFNGIRTNLKIDGINLLHLTTNNFFSITNPSEWPSLTPRDIWLINGSAGVIGLNTFASVLDDRRHPNRINIDVERHPVDQTSGNDLIIDSNNFMSSMALHAVRLASEVNRVQITNNAGAGGLYTKTYEMGNSWGRNTLQLPGGRGYSNMNTVPEGDVEGKFEASSTNKPGASNSAGRFKQFQFEDGGRTQEAHVLFPSGDANKIFTRVMVSGTWGPWVEK